ncbi:hypothetical protein [Actinoplanes cyaneus]|uniref:hypothetical protein n=1 Tax=Actinoplanes cyaneus TaxID=52696 RepID=UPI0019440E08|nr:hypothetical protein [Actinoplanes cyaneus]MCW2144353.1 hypothetical protein [Actinoplanes cyaneus]
MIEQYRLPPGFHLDDVANLAPICTPCNREKSNHDYTDAPVLLKRLGDARRRGPRVAARVRDMQAAGTVGRHLVAAATADLSGPRARREFLEFAPAVVQTLALLDEDRVDFLVHRDLSLGLDYCRLPVTLALDRQGQTRWSWVQEICGSPWSHLLRAGMQVAVDATEARLVQSIREQCGATADIESSTTEHLPAALTLDDVHRDGTTMTCRISGKLEAAYRALVHVPDPDFPEEASTYVEAGVDDAVIQFRLAISWDLGADPSTAPDIDLAITSFEGEAGVNWRMK